MQQHWGTSRREERRKGKKTPKEGKKSKQKAKLKANIKKKHNKNNGKIEEKDKTPQTREKNTHTKKTNDKENPRGSQVEK